MQHKEEQTMNNNNNNNTGNGVQYKLYNTVRKMSTQKKNARKIIK